MSALSASSRPLQAVGWMVGATLSFTAMAVAGREAASDLDTFELMLYRSLLGLVIVVVIGGARGLLGDVARSDLGLHGLRNIGHFAGQNLWLFAVATIPLAQVFALEFTTPLWVALFAPFVLGERWTRPRIIAVILGFLGILLVAQPGRVELSGGVIAAALAALGFTVSILSTKLLSLRGNSTLNILFWMTVMQAVFGLVCAGYDADITLPDRSNIAFVAIIGLGGLTAHYCITTALSLAPATIVAPLDFARLPLIALVGWAFYGEVVGAVMVIGALLIVGGNLVNVFAEKRTG
ncbi:MAG: DMT family transporter [Pseudomonadota bacterium]